MVLLAKIGIISLVLAACNVQMESSPHVTTADCCYNGAQGGSSGVQLATWNPATDRADIVVAKDGSGNFTTINQAVDALSKMVGGGGKRAVVYVKAGIYNENVVIASNLTNIMVVGDGINKTIVTGHKNVHDGDKMSETATFAVSGDGFWARDVTFQNTAGPQKFQALALLVDSDASIFYRCSFDGYQDTLYVRKKRQFFRDCYIYGTVDFIFGNSAVVFQNCDILVKRPMAGQANMVTAQGRTDLQDKTGISIQGSRIRPTPEFAPFIGTVQTFLGRPWKMYSTTVISRTYIDGFINPRGWEEWNGTPFALSTLYYAEYKNTGYGASTKGRVNWTGYHVLYEARQVRNFTVINFIQGDLWINESGVPYWPQI